LGAHRAGCRFSFAWVPMLSWFRLIDSAKSVNEVIAVTRDYLATWQPEELSLLPKECRPSRMKTEADLDDLHVCLVEEYRHNRLHGEALAALQKMTSFVVRASIRVAQLQGESAEEDGPRTAADHSSAGREA
jgi:hypothetical protein